MNKGSVAASGLQWRRSMEGPLLQGPGTTPPLATRHTFLKSLATDDDDGDGDVYCSCVLCLPIANSVVTNNIYREGLSTCALLTNKAQNTNAEYASMHSHALLAHHNHHSKRIVAIHPDLLVHGPK